MCARQARQAQLVCTEAINCLQPVLSCADPNQLYWAWRVERSLYKHCVTGIKSSLQCMRRKISKSAGKHPASKGQSVRKTQQTASRERKLTLLQVWRSGRPCSNHLMCNNSLTQEEEEQDDAEEEQGGLLFSRSDVLAGVVWIPSPFPVVRSNPRS